MSTHTETPHLSDFTDLPRRTLLEQYAAWAQHVPKRLLDLDDEQLDTAFRAESGLGRWPVRVLIGHLADCEIVYTFRMRRTASELNPVLANFDPDTFADAGLYGDANGGADKPVAGFVALIHTLRAWTTEWLSTLDDETWSRRALHPNDGDVDLHHIVAKAVWHVAHHGVYLDRKLNRLLGPETDA